MTSTRSIIQRLNPENVFGKVQCLHRQEALFAEEEWFWSEERLGAFAFDTHAEAEKKAGAMPYMLADDAAKTVLWPFAVVMGNPQLVQEHERRQASRTASMHASVERHRVSPEETFADLERKKLA